MYRYLWDQRVDGFAVGVITGLSSRILLVQHQRLTSMAAISLLAAFAISSTLTRPKLFLSSGARWSSLTRQASLGIIAAIAGWLIGS